MFQTKFPPLENMESVGYVLLNGGACPHVWKRHPDLHFCHVIIMLDVGFGVGGLAEFDLLLEGQNPSK